MNKSAWMASYIAILLVVSVLLVGCAPMTASDASAQASEPVTLNVFAAASLTDAFTEIGAGFDAAHPGVMTVFNFAGSNQLAAQIGEAAPADVFASANNTQMNVVTASGRIVPDTPATFARNHLVIVALADNPAGVTTIADLAIPGLKVIFAAPEVPVGQYALDFLDKAAADPALGEQFKAGVLANIVSQEENVRAVLAKVTLGEADAGIVYSSDVMGAASEVTQIEIPDALNTIASYPIASLADSANPELAQAFVDWVLSPEGQAVLEAYGFIPAAGD